MINIANICAVTMTRPPNKGRFKHVCIYTFHTRQYQTLRAPQNLSNTIQVK